MLLPICIALFVACELKQRINDQYYKNIFDVCFPIAIALLVEMSGLIAPKLILGGVYVLMSIAYLGLWAQKIAF
jgi:hypothetical protein